MADSSESTTMTTSIDKSNLLVSPDGKICWLASFGQPVTTEELKAYVRYEEAMKEEK